MNFGINILFLNEKINYFYFPILMFDFIVFLNFFFKNIILSFQNIGIDKVNNQE